MKPSFTKCLGGLILFWSSVCVAEDSVLDHLRFGPILEYRLLRPASIGAKFGLTPQWSLDLTYQYWPTMQSQGVTMGQTGYQLRPRFFPWAGWMEKINFSVGAGSLSSQGTLNTTLLARSITISDDYATVRVSPGLGIQWGGQIDGPFVNLDLGWNFDFWPSSTYSLELTGIPETNVALQSKMADVAKIVEDFHKGWPVLIQIQMGYYF